MRIISDFHDYYDSAQAYGIDKTVVFQRNRDKEPLACIDYPPLKNTTEDASSVNYYFVPFLINVAGKNFLGFRASARSGSFRYGDTPPDQFFYDAESLITFVNEKVTGWERYNNQWYRKDARTWGGEYAFTSLGLRESFKQANVFDDSLNIAHSLPVFMVTHRKRMAQDLVIPGLWTGTQNFDRKHDHVVWANPELKRLQFYKVMDAFSIYQELDMFISGVLPRAGAPVVEISDKVRAEKHGMDKWSFRKKVR